MVIDLTRRVWENWEWLETENGTKSQGWGDTEPRSQGSDCGERLRLNEKPREAEGRDRSQEELRRENWVWLSQKTGLSMGRRRDWE